MVLVQKLALRRRSRWPNKFRVRGCHPLWPAVPGRSPTQSNHTTTQGWSRFARRYSGDSRNIARFEERMILLSAKSELLVSLPVGTKMFQFPTFPHSKHLLGGTTGSPVVGFPIRTSPDQCLLASSPTLIAGCHVLLRLLLPRHPHMCPF